METSEFIGLIATGPNAALIATIGSDPTWHVAEDWGAGPGWQAVRVPAGVKFRRLKNGLVAEEVLVTRGNARDRRTHEALLGLAQVPTHLVHVERTDLPPNRLAPHVLYPGVGHDS